MSEIYVQATLGTNYQECNINDYIKELKGLSNANANHYRRRIPNNLKWTVLKLFAINTSKLPDTDKIIKLNEIYVQATLGTNYQKPMCIITLIHSKGNKIKMHKQPIHKPLGTAEYIELMAANFSSFKKLMQESNNDLEYHIKSSDLRLLLTLGTDSQYKFVQEHIRALLNGIRDKL
ncbi:UNVERIFIED_ORG: hypothetical protein [Escherichia phage CMSTMSU]